MFKAPDPVGDAQTSTNNLGQNAAWATKKIEDAKETIAKLKLLNKEEGLSGKVTDVIREEIRGTFEGKNNPTPETLNAQSVKSNCVCD